MKLSGTQTINAARERVWTVLNDVEALRVMLPGVESLDEVQPNTYCGVAKIGVAGTKDVYTGTVRLSDFQPPESYRIHGEAKGKPGQVKGFGLIRLTENAPDSTTLYYEGDLQVGGMIANVGPRLIEGAAKVLVTQGLKALAQRIEQQP